MVKQYQILKEKALKIKRSVSNLIWLDGNDKISSFLTLMSNSPYISAVELSLFNIFNSTTVSSKQMNFLLNEIHSNKIEISGLHNIFADVENFQGSILTSEILFNKALERIQDYIQYAKYLGTKNLSLDYMYFIDKNRISQSEANKIFLNFLDKVSEFLKGSNIIVHIFPITGNYLSNYVEAVNLLEKREYKQIKILVDLVEIFNTFSNDIKFFRDKERFFSHFHIANLDSSPASFDDIPLHNKIVNLSHYMNYKNDYFVLKASNLDNDKKEDLNNYQHYIHVFKEIYQVPIALSPFCSKLFPNLVYRHLSPDGPDRDHLRLKK